MGISLSDKRILIVEDQEGVRKALRVILGPLYCVDSAKTACDALKIIIECPIDLVIMDVGLPDYDGIELLRRVRMSGSDVKVIMMSGGGNIESAKEALQLGAMAYLLKPFNFSELLTLVEDGLTAEHAEPVSGVAMNVSSIPRDEISSRPSSVSLPVLGLSFGGTVFSRRWSSLSHPFH